MRYFITNVLPHHLSGKYKISYAAANFSWALIHSSVFDEVFSIAPLNVSGAIDDVDMPELVYASPYEPVGATSADGNAAVDYLIDAARTYGPDLIYVATGPLSNLALALERDAAAMMSIGRVVVMGGALTVPGNVSAGAEANMASDPEAADAVLRSGRKLTMVGLDVTHRVVLTRRDIAGWTGSGTMAGCAFASMVEHYIGSYEMNAPYLGGCALHDPLAVAVAIDPTLVGALGCNLRVDLLGEYRGRTICDERRVADPDKGALVALTVDAPRFLSEFKTRMARVLG